MSGFQCFPAVAATSPYKLWAMLGEVAAQAKDRVNLTNGAVEPFVDADNVTISDTLTANSALIPLLTSNNSSGTAFASSSYGAGFEAYRTFDRSMSTYWNAASGSSLPQYVGYIIAAKKTISTVSLTGYAGGGNPTAGTIQTSSDTTNGTDGTWVDRASFSSALSTSAQTFPFSAAAENVKAMRVRVTAVQTAGSAPVITEIQCTGSDIVASASVSGGYLANATGTVTTVTLESVAVSSAVAGKIVFTASNEDQSSPLDVGRTGSNLLEVHPVRSGTVGAALAFISEQLGSNTWRFTSEEFSLSGATAFGAQFQSFARSVAPNFRIYEAYFLWR